MVGELQATIWRVALTLAGLYQLGACPCGCLDHNGWNEAVISLCSFGESPQPAAPDPPCDDNHPAPNAMTIASGAGGQRLRTERLLDAFSWALQPTVEVAAAINPAVCASHAASPAPPSGFADRTVLRL